MIPTSRNQSGGSGVMLVEFLIAEQAAEYGRFNPHVETIELR
jgi:hypothetical protein